MSVDGTDCPAHTCSGARAGQVSPAAMHPAGLQDSQLCLARRAHVPGRLPCGQAPAQLHVQGAARPGPVTRSRRVLAKVACRLLFAERLAPRGRCQAACRSEATRLVSAMPPLTCCCLSQLASPVCMRSRGVHLRARPDRSASAAAAGRGVCGSGLRGGPGRDGHVQRAAGRAQGAGPGLPQPEPGARRGAQRGHLGRAHGRLVQPALPDPERPGHGARTKENPCPHVPGRFTYRDERWMRR